MIIPVRCFNCNKVLGHLWDPYMQKIQEGTSEAEVEKEKKNNSDLLAQLTLLRQKFQQMSVANRALASDVAKSKVIQDVSPGSPLVTGR